jgi:hypothetical protein
MTKVNLVLNYSMAVKGRQKENQAKVDIPIAPFQQFGATCSAQA